MAKSWSGFAPQNQTAKTQWKLLEITRALGPDLMLVPAESEEEASRDEELPAETESAEAKPKPPE